MQRIRFTLTIPAQEYLRYYQGTASQISVRAEDGRRIQFPAYHLRPFVNADGLRGRFEMTLDEHHRFLGLRRL